MFLFQKIVNKKLEFINLNVCCLSSLIFSTLIENKK